MGSAAIPMVTSPPEACSKGTAPVVAAVEEVVEVGAIVGEAAVVGAASGWPSVLNAQTPPAKRPIATVANEMRPSRLLRE